MSRLANLIEAHQTGRVKLINGNHPVVLITEGLSEISSLNIVASKEYRIEVKLGVKGYASTAEEIVELKKMATRQILEEVFGEFRPLVRTLERAIYERDFDAARTALQNLELEMRY